MDTRVGSQPAPDSLLPNLSAASLQALIDNGSDAVVVWDRSEVVRYASSATTHVLGHQPSDLVGQSRVEFLRFENPNGAAVAWQQAITSINNASPIEWRTQRQSGEFRWLRSRGMNLVDGPDAGAVVCYFQDITGQKRAEEYLAIQLATLRIMAEAETLEMANSELLNAIAKISGWELGSIWRMQRTKGVLRCESTWHFDQRVADEFLRISGETELAPGIGLPGRAWTQEEAVWISDILRDDNFPRMGAARKLGLRSAFAFPMRSAGEILGVIEFFSHEVRAPDQGLIDMVVGLGAQVGQYTERRRAAEELTLSNARNEAILESALDCIITIDHQGSILEFNPAAERTFHYRREDVIGRELAEIVVPPSLRERHRQGMARYLSTGTGPVIGRRIEITAMRHGGEEFPIELAITRIATSGPPTFTAYLRDITDRLSNEREIRELNQTLEERIQKRTSELQDANSELEAFSYSVSHDLRAPLRHISGYIEMILGANTVVDQQTLEDLRTIRDTARRAGKMVDELLAFSRLGRSQIRRSAVNLREVVDDVLSDLAPDIANRAIEWRVGELLKVEADPALLRTAITNLVSNAIKYTRPREVAVIEIGSRVEVGKAIVYVKDNGVGFDSTYVDKLFGVFQRLHRDEEFEGTGIGLATVRRIVQRHDGRVWAESGLELGATFYLSLPLLSK